MRNGKYNFNGKRVIISRTDSLGDVVLTLPVVAILKRLFPQVTLIFLGRAYTRALLECNEYIDEISAWDEFDDPVEGLRSLSADAIIHIFPNKEIARSAKIAGIPIRAGTRNRLYHWRSCNKLIRLSRRHSSLHEAQLNLKLLIPFGAKRLFSQEEIHGLFGLTNTPSLSAEHSKLLSRDHFNLIIHPGSRGSAREWGVENFSALIGLLPADRYKIFITGSKEEESGLHDQIFNAFPEAVNLCGTFQLGELISFIANADGLVATSTGPLHIAAAIGRTAIGIYPPIKPMHPGRWAPVGPCAYYLTADHACNKCRKKGDCSCMQEITPEMVKNKLFTIFR